MKNKVMKKLNTAMLVSALCISTQSASAVSLSNNGIGQALIYPYYTVRDNQIGLLTVENNSSVTKELHIQVREGKMGKVTLTFNIYLTAQDSWTAFLSSSTEGATLFTADGSCTAPQISHPIELLNVNYQDDEANDNSSDRLREGSIEIIELAEISGNHADLISSADCAGIVNDWTQTSGWGGGSLMDTSRIQDGGSISGTFNIIDPVTGSSASYNATALSDFDGVENNHTTPGEDFGLEQAGNSAGDITSTIIHNGVAITSHWENDSNANGQTGLDAVSAVLMANKVNNLFSTEEFAGIITGSDWIISQPTRYGYPQIPFIAGIEPYQVAADQNGACEEVSLTAYTREGTVINNERIPSLCWATTILNFASPSTLSSALGQHIPLVGATSTALATGKVILGIHHEETPPDTLPVGYEEHYRLTSDEGHEYTGFPVTGFLIQEFVDTDVQTTANYMSLYPHKNTREVTTE